MSASGGFLGKRSPAIFVLTEGALANEEFPDSSSRHTRDSKSQFVQSRPIETVTEVYNVTLNKVKGLLSRLKNEIPPSPKAGSE